MKNVAFEPVVRVSPISISDAPSTIKPSKNTIKDKQIHDYMKRTSSPYEELGSDELPFLYHNDKELPPVDLLLEKDGRTLVKARKPYHQTTDSPELVKETPDFGGARRHIKRKTRKTKQKGKGIGDSKPIKPPTPTPPTKKRKSVQFSPSTKSPSSPKQNKTKTMFISKNKNKSKAVVQYVNRQREQDLKDMMLGKIPLEGGNKRFIKMRSKRHRGGTHNINLIEAIQSGNTTIVRELLENGADANEENEENEHGMTALIEASRLGHTEIVRELLKNGADVNLKDNEWWSALTWASANGHIGVVRELLKNDANVNAMSFIGLSPLHMASINGHTEIVRELLKNGADVNLKDDDGWTAFRWAQGKRHTEIVNLIEKAIKTEQITKANKQKTMGLVRDRVEKVPSLQTLAHRNIDTHATNLYNKAVTEGAVPPIGSKLGGKRKTRKSKKSNKNSRKTRKNKKRTRRRTYKKRGGGTCASREQPQTFDNENNPQVAEPMPTDLPLPPGMERVPTISYPSAQSSAAITGTLKVDPQGYEYFSSKQERIPNATELKGPKISYSTADSLIDMFPKLQDLEEDESKRRKLLNAMMNYKYHVNYVDCFHQDLHGDYGKRNNQIALERQLYYLLTCWQRHGNDDINELIYTLKSPYHEEIGY